MSDNDRFTFTHQNLQENFDDFQKAFEHYGVAVITDVFSAQECDGFTDSILTAFESLGTGVRRDDVDTWKTKPQNLLPSQTRVGLFQQTFSNLPAVWSIRSDQRLVDLFARLYNDDRLIVSGDGINVVINGRTKKANPSKQDWAHLDSVGPFDGTIQGQVVCTDTTAAFRCSPRSHSLYDKFMKDELKKTKVTNNNWHKLNDEQIEWYKGRMPEDGRYQIRIPVPRGSVILWYSNLLHSACSALETVENPPADNPFMGTRCVVYVSYQTVAMYERRPPIVRREGKNKRKKNVYSTSDHIEARAATVSANVSTNHRGMPMPYKRGRFPPPPCHPIIDSIQQHPEEVYEMLGFVPMPLWDDRCARLSGIKPYPKRAEQK